MSVSLVGKTMLNRTNTGKVSKFPIKVVQFGEGNFLRAFVDYAFQELNEMENFQGGIAVVQPIENGMVDILNNQDGLFHLFMNGYSKGKEIQEVKLITNIVQCVNPYKSYASYLELAHVPSLEYIISNTTEAGIVYVECDTVDMKPASSFPAKLTQFLLERFNYFNGSASKGLTIIPCELINYNANILKDIVLRYIKEWELGKDFESWVTTRCSFHNTLVDRIVPGYPRGEIEAYNNKIDYVDNLIVAAERFFLWVIEGDNSLIRKLPFNKTGLDVKIVADMQPYRTRKVRILNGAHTAMVPMSLLYGNETVEESVKDAFTGQFIQQAIFDEIIPTLMMDKESLMDFADAVLDRFRNPFIRHQLASIALNSISKFKVRVLPSLLSFINIEEKLPTALTFSLACLIRFYKGSWNGNALPVQDSEDVKQVFREAWLENGYSLISKTILSNTNLWEKDLTTVPKLEDAVALALEEIERHGISEAFINFNKQF